jgi:hypothetical protein
MACTVGHFLTGEALLPGIDDDVDEFVVVLVAGVLGSARLPSGAEGKGRDDAGAGAALPVDLLNMAIFSDILFGASGFGLAGSGRAGTGGGSFAPLFPSFIFAIRSAMDKGLFSSAIFAVMNNFLY